MNVELRDLRWAVTASQYRSLRQAAEVLGIRQSTLSRRLRDIENSLDAVLFERTNGGTRATVAGLEFIESARRILEETDDAFRRVRSRSRGERGRLAIGVHASFATGNMRAYLREYRRRFPEVDIHTVDGGQKNLFCALASNAIDVAIMTSDSRNGEGRCLPLWSERVIVAIPESHPLSGLSAVEWENLAGERLLVPSHGPGPELERLLTTKIRQGGPSCLLHQDVCIERLMTLVGLGFGLLLVLEGATGAHYDGVVYREVRDHAGSTRVDFMACWRDENSNPTLGHFLDMLRERYPDLTVAAEVA